MPALGGGHALLKWVTSFPGNPARGLPTVTGLVLLSDAEDGRLLAVLDAGAVTALRTAAAAVIAADALAREDASSWAVVGCGVNGAETARMLVAHGRDTARVGRRRGAASGRRGGARRRGRGQCRRSARVRRRGDRDARLRGAVRRGSLRPGQHVSLMGADGPGKAEVAITELSRARLFCDDWEQASHGGELAAGVAGERRRLAMTSPSSAPCSRAQPRDAAAKTR